ncbi:hypothetical protein TNIN_80011 [Trichonephila inaurata madagascariensis]|uniref:Uncharacterized protein n=1 Tax=Trichonephila inaurata madagascariensis TaxID=2747483 RepID=A0A8X6IU94_9ARAC|nr:hypothetical protein TNIN_80011 [Trichonephila inaurata madagascariensis]
MFRQFKIFKKDLTEKEFSGGDSPTEPKKEYPLTTVSFSPPHFFYGILRHFHWNKKIIHPSRATLVILRCDLLSGSATKKGAIQLVLELQEMMKKGGFSLRKCV